MHQFEAAFERALLSRIERRLLADAPRAKRRPQARPPDREEAPHMPRTPRVAEPSEVGGRVRGVVRGLGPDVRAAPRAEGIARAAGAVAGRVAGAVDVRVGVVLADGRAAPRPAP